MIGAPQVALKVPFAFPLEYGGHADLYLLSQK